MPRISGDWTRPSPSSPCDSAPHRYGPEVPCSGLLPSASALDVADERRPHGRWPPQPGSIRVLRVADRDDPGQVLRDLDTLAPVAAAPAAFAPHGAGQVGVLWGHPAPPPGCQASWAAIRAMRSTDWPVPSASARRWSNTTL